MVIGISWFEEAVVKFFFQQLKRCSFVRICREANLPQFSPLEDKQGRELCKAFVNAEDRRMKERMKLMQQATSVGTIAIAENAGAITQLFFCGDTLPPDIERAETALLHEAFQQLQGYLLGKRREFSLPLAPAGTPFMQRVWQCVTSIPYGTTASYQEVAIAVGNSRAVRAVGMANHRNPLPIIIPCHRVIGSDGSLTGYRGGLSLKMRLLELEQQYFCSVPPRIL